jgi:RNA polymerase sigma factor (sigma-70 family)
VTTIPAGGSGSGAPGLRDVPPADLVRSAAAGDAGAWDELVRRYGGLLWTICRDHRLGPADAADVFQLTWLRLLERLDTLQDPARVGAWLATTCRHECLAVIRRARRTSTSSEAVELRAEPAGGADVEVLRTDRDATLWEAFGRLGERCRTVLTVLIAEAEDGPPNYARAAERLQMPVGSLGPTRQRCLAQLRQLLAESGIYAVGADS